MAGRGRTPRPRIFAMPRSGDGQTLPLPPAPTPTGPPVAPPWLDGEARKEWDRLVPLLDAAGKLSALDQGLLTTYVVAYADLLECTRQIAALGRTVPTGTGGVKTSPYVSQQRSAMQAVRLLGAQLGLSPEGRLRLGMEAPPSFIDPLQEFLDS